MMLTYVQCVESPSQGLITTCTDNHIARSVGGKLMEQTWTGISADAGNAYRKVQEARKELRRAHHLGFHRAQRQQIKGGNSIVSIKISKLSDEEFALLREKMQLLPEKKRVDIKHDLTKPLTQVLGVELAYAIIEVKPDMKKIAALAEPIPDIEKRIAKIRNGE